MSWLSEYMRPKVRGWLAKRETPDNLWFQCPSCQKMVYHRDFEKNLRVCPNCGFHARLSAKERLKMTFDNGEFKEFELPKTAADPLRFKDTKKYTDRYKEAREKTGLNDALVVGYGTIGGQKAVVAAMDFSFMGGSMGAAVGEGLVLAAEQALAKKSALIVFTSSGGARMQEGLISLMQMPRSIIATRMVKEAGLPYITVLTDPTTGGVTASFAMLGDIAMAEPGALIGFAGARVIEQTVREILPEGFQRAEYLRDHGIIDMVVPRQELTTRLATVLKLLTVPRADSGAKEVLSLPQTA